MHRLMDRFIELLKWPVAVYMLVSLPAYIQSLAYFKFASLQYLVLGGGFFLFFIARSMMDSSVKVNMEILAHEMTHAFFAFITFHKLKGIRIEGDNSGGEMAFEGEGNWLIIIAPYFFPLFGLVYLIIFSLYTSFVSTSLFLNGILGYFIGYHLDTVGSQIHEKQTDLPKVSYKFCAMFLPSANLWAVGSMLAFNSKGWAGIWTYQKLIAYLNAKNFDFVLDFIRQFF